MSSSIIGYSSPQGYPAVRGQLVVEVAIIVQIPICPICGQEHRFVLADAVWVSEHMKLWQLTCPRIKPAQHFPVRVMSSSGRAALKQGEEIAAETQLGKTWELGLTWAPASYRRAGAIVIHDTAALVEGSSDEDLNQESNG